MKIKYSFDFLLKYKLVEGSPFVEKYIVCDNEYKEKLVFRKYFTCKEDDIVVKKIRSILNKLSEKNFEKLFLDIVELNIVRETILKKTLEEIVNKAIFESKYSYLYAILCEKINKKNIRIKRK